MKLCGNLIFSLRRLQAMMYENDKLNIPEDIKRMSVPELRYERKKIYEEIKKDKKKCDKNTEKRKCTITFSL